MPSLHVGNPVYVYLLWNLGVFFVAWLPHSFLEWLSHRFILHSKAIVRFAYQEHDQRHHEEYGHGDTFHVPGRDYGRDFNLRDWALFLAFVMPLWAGLEWWTGKPLLIGAFLSACAYLHTFNVIHRHFHAPNGSWLEGCAVYRFLHEHHRMHHKVRHRNLNVVFPFADLCLGTLVTKGSRPAA